ncbi:hypothetical protein PVAP13_9NG070956, partial [Panicum virgatum]
MDVLDTLAVRFHFGGQFVCHGQKKSYVGGREAMSYIDRDKVSLPEIVGHLRDHYSACLKMSQCIVEMGVAEIFVEDGGAEKQCEAESD